MQLKRALFILVLGGILAIPAQARADWLFTPFVGASLNRGSDAFDIDFDGGATTFGGSLGFMGSGVFGFEVDFGYSPNFFKTDDVTTVDGNVTTLMGNLIIGVPIGGQTGGGIRPYVSGGAGLLRSRLDDVDDFFDVDKNSFGVNAGGGVLVFFSDSVGLRGDMRYFRSLEDDDEDDLDWDLGSLDFWRASVGVTFRF